MRESINDGVLAPYSAPAMRVVPTDGGRMLTESLIGDTGSLGVFDGAGLGWNDGPVDGGLDVFNGAGLGWNGGPVDGGLNMFTGAGLGWNDEPSGGSTDVFTGAGLGWDTEP